MDLYCVATADTPEIVFKFSTNTFIVSGEAYPEDADKFFRPFISQLQKHLDAGNGQLMVFNFRLAYFNSVTAKILYDLFGRLADYAKAYPGAVVLNWHYDVEDDMMSDFGLEIKEDYPELTFNAVTSDGR